MRIADWSLHFYRLPYAREVRWVNGVEDTGVFALLRLTSDEGATGIAEGTIKARWSGVSNRSLAAALEDVLLPRVEGIDLSDPGAVTAALRGVPEQQLAKALLDTACWTLRAHAAGRPLWQLWNAVPEVDLTWAVTRQAPAAMAAEAAVMVARYGFRTLKVKGGQGPATDLAALREIRAAVGDAIELYVDANSAYAREEGEAYVRAIAEAGATVAEDPCPLEPDAEFETLQRAGRVPILVDSACASPRDARLFLARGARALSAKPGRVGVSEARAIASLAGERGAKVVVGLYAESALGALLSLQLAAAIPAAQRLVPAEQTFFLDMREQVVAAVPAIADGRTRLPATPDYSQLVDWERVKRFAL